MFKVGDSVVYPYHGAGKIKDMEEKDILGQKMSYFVVFFPLNHVTLMLPEKNIEESGLRKIIDADQLEEVANALSTSVPSVIKETARPYSKENETLLKSGNILDAASVIANLTSKKCARNNGLHMEDRKNLDRAKQFIVSELMLVKKFTEDEAMTFIDEHCQEA
ncbi:CarD family transcriptional regulator [Bacillus sp. A301a_S52]|jgi:CarD family transcriptional regulator|nr:CarD family transcriptional regulator [Bacillus sp. A301a_S52]